MIDLSDMIDGGLLKYKGTLNMKSLSTDGSGYTLKENEVMKQQMKQQMKKLQQLNGKNLKILLFCKKICWYFFQTNILYIIYAMK